MRPTTRAFRPLVNAAVAIAVIASASAYALIDGPFSPRGTSGSEVMVRVAGEDRYGTAVQVSKRQFPTGASVAYLASGETFPDALSAAAAAASDNAALLLTRASSLPSVTLAELTRLNPRRIIVVGGVGAVSKVVVDRLTAAFPGRVNRVGGSDRFDTSARLASQEFRTAPRTVYVANGDGFADALAAGPSAAASGAPVVLTRRDALPGAVSSYLSKLRPTRIVVVGGIGAVSDGVMAALRAYAREVDRLAGADRYGTAVAVSGATHSAEVDTVYVSTGLDYADGLAAAPAAASSASPLLLTRTDGIPAELTAEIERLNPKRIVIVGGTAAVSESVEVMLAAERSDRPGNKGRKPSPTPTATPSASATLTPIASPNVVTPAPTATPSTNVLEFWLVDPVTDQRVRRLTAGETMPTSFAIEAVGKAGSVQVLLNGSFSHLENAEPFGACKDNNGDFQKCSWPGGKHVVTVKVWTLDNAAGTVIGTYSIEVNVRADTVAPAPTAAPTTAPTMAPVATPIPPPAIAPSTLNPSGLGRPGPRAGYTRLAETEFTANIPLGSWTQDENRVLKSRGDDWWPDSREQNCDCGGRYSSRYTTSQHDGMLDIWLHAQKEGGDYFKHDGSFSESQTQFLVNAPVTQVGKRSAMDINVIAKFPVVPWAKAAWLMWASGTNVNGEEDWPEMRLDDGVGVSAFHHFARPEKGQRAWSVPDVRNTDWHLYTIRWVMNGYVEFYLDGRLIGRSTEYMPKEPMQYIMQTETLLMNVADLPGPPFAQGSVLVDWIAIDVPG